MKRFFRVIIPSNIFNVKVPIQFVGCLQKFMAVPAAVNKKKGPALSLPWRRLWVGVLVLLAVSTAGCAGLYFKDSEGAVDLDDIVDYLRAEGFIAKVDCYGGGLSRGVNYLEISLEK